MKIEALTQEKCAVKLTIDLVSGKWKPSILYHLGQRSQRFGQLQRQIPGISRRILTLHLKELERDHLIQRTAYASPLKVEYSLSHQGSSLIPILVLMRDWGNDYLATLT